MSQNDYDILALVFALVLFVLAALNVPSRVGLIAAGLACWVTVPLLAAIKAH